MSSNVTRQLVHVVHDCYTPGHSKRADKFNPAIDTSWKIYSSSSRRDMLDMAKDFGEFLREHFPDTTRFRQITSGNIQAYIDSKAATCVDATLGKIMSRIGKLEICCRHTCVKERRNFDWEVKTVAIPVSTKNADFVKDTPVPLDVSKTVIAAMRTGRTEVCNAVTLSAYLGMRSGETQAMGRGRGSRRRSAPDLPYGDGWYVFRTHIRKQYRQMNTLYSPVVFRASSSFHCLFYQQ